jgi:hypothetical protein
MPKKKLTKAQVKSKMRTAANQLYDLFNDKFAHPDSFVPMSGTKLFDTVNLINKARSRVK